MAINVKTWGPLAAAIVLGGIAAKAGYDLVSRKPAEKVVVQKVTRVAVANGDVAAGASLHAVDLVMTSVPETAAPGGTFDAPERLAGRVTTVSLRKGQPIFESMLAPEGSSHGLTAIVPEGMRAVTMEINEVSGVAGLIVPGCRVDVVSTFPSDNGQMMTKTICRSLQIVAVGRKYAEMSSKEIKDVKDATPVSRDGDAEPPLYRSVTMLATPRESEILDLAAHTGSPRLVLRSSRDSKNDTRGGMSEGITVAELRGTAKPQPSAVASFFANLMNNIVAATQKPPVEPVSDNRMVSLFGQPTTQPNTRQVTIIRNTHEESVQVKIDKPAFKGGVFVNTPTDEAIPGSK